MQKKLMLRPTAVPSEHLPSEMTSYAERSDSPDNTSSSYVSMEHHSDSSTSGIKFDSPQVAPTVAINNNNNIIVNNNNINTINNNHTVINNNHGEYQGMEDVNVKMDNNFTYQNATPIVQATNVVTYQQPSSYDSLLTLMSNVPYQEINETPAYMISDGTEIDQSRLASVLNKDEGYGDGTVTYVINFMDY
jgi:biopolymer transport protein ExbD